MIRLHALHWIRSKPAILSFSQSAVEAAIKTTVASVAGEGVYTPERPMAVHFTTKSAGLILVSPWISGTTHLLVWCMDTLGLA
jgi:hypothetical protein